MLQLEIEMNPEGWDEEKQEFVEPVVKTLQLEHSLVSISKWESKWCKPFLSKKAKTYEETIDYIKCMTITKNVDPEVYKRITHRDIVQVNKYMELPMTATTFSDKQRRKNSSKMVTAELIYYWMVSLNIPFDPCQKWHLSRLLTLIRVCEAENQPSKRMSNREIMSSNAALNAARRKQLKSRG